MEIPLPIPCSEMSSPSHIRITEPAVMAVIANAHCEVDKSIEVAVLARADSFRIKIYANDWTIASGTVAMRVH